MKTVPLIRRSGGLAAVAMVDDKDYATVTRYRWYMVKSTKGVGHRYAQSFINGKSVMMHRLLLTAPKGLLVDHKDNNGLNNQRENIRLCSFTENNRNRGACKCNSSGHKLITYRESRLKAWRASLKVFRKTVFDKSFSTLEEAIQYRNERVSYFHGQFTNLD